MPRRTYEIIKYRDKAAFDALQGVQSGTWGSKVRAVKVAQGIQKQDGGIVKVQSSDREFIEIFGRTKGLKESLAEIVTQQMAVAGTDSRGAIRDCISELLILAEKAGMDEEERLRLLEGAREVMVEETGVPATYVSVWDSGLTLRSKCRWFPDLKVVRDIEDSGADVGNETLEREFVELKDGTELGAADDVEFEY